MATGINFAQQTSLYQEKEKNVAIMKGTVVALFLMFAVAAAYGGVFVYKKAQEGELASVNAALEQERNSRNYNELTEALDIASRLNFTEEISRRQNFWNKFLAEVSGLMLQSMSMTSVDAASPYKLESGASQTEAMGVVAEEESSLQIALVAKNLEDISKQIVAFNSSPRIEKTVVHGISLDEVGIKFNLDISLSPHALERGTFSTSNQEQ